MRGSIHDKDILEFTIDADGMHLGKPFRDVTGILAGNPRETPFDIAHV
jgi:circadian clock protein KaiC